MKVECDSTSVPRHHSKGNTATVVLPASETRSCMVASSIWKHQGFVHVYCRYEGVDCNIDINECVRQTVQCADNAGCLNLQGSYNCTCWPGYSGIPSLCQFVLDSNMPCYACCVMQVPCCAVTCCAVLCMTAHCSPVHLCCPALCLPCPPLPLACPALPCPCSAPKCIVQCELGE